MAKKTVKKSYNLKYDVSYTILLRLIDVGKIVLEDMEKKLKKGDSIELKGVTIDLELIKAGTSKKKSKKKKK